MICVLMMSNGQMDDQPAPTRSRPRLRASLIAMGMAAGVAISLALAIVVLLATARGTMPPLTAESLDEASARWQASGIDSYNLRLVLDGREQGVIELKVRGGEPTAMKRDEYVPQQRTWQYWTIPEQFAMLERELTGDTKRLFGVSDRSQVILQAEFDPRLGYPRRYQRQVLGSDQAISWEIVHFEEIR